MFALAPWNLHPSGLPVTPDSVQPRWSCYSESDMAPALRKLAAEVKDWSWGIPLIWKEKHQVVEGEIAQAAELVDFGLSICAAAH